MSDIEKSLNLLKEFNLILSGPDARQNAKGELYTVLKYCAGNRHLEKTKQYIQWIVNNQLGLMLETILQLDTSLLNRLFSPTEENTSKLTPLSVLENIQQLIDHSERFFSATSPFEFNVYCFALFFEMESGDFDIAVERALSSKKNESRFSTDFSLYSSVFKTDHIPNALKILRMYFDWDLFRLVWDCVDEFNFELIYDVIINQTAFEEESRRRNYWLPVRNPVQVRLYRILNSIEQFQFIECHIMDGKLLDAILPNWTNKERSEYCIFLVDFSREEIRFNDWPNKKLFDFFLSLSKYFHLELQSYQELIKNICFEEWGETAYEVLHNCLTRKSQEEVLLKCFEELEERQLQFIQILNKHKNLLTDQEFIDRAHRVISKQLENPTENLLYSLGGLVARYGSTAHVQAGLRIDKEPCGFVIGYLENTNQSGKEILEAIYDRIRVSISSLMRCRMESTFDFGFSFLIRQSADITEILEILKGYKKDWERECPLSRVELLIFKNKSITQDNLSFLCLVPYTQLQIIQSRLAEVWQLLDDEAKLFCLQFTFFILKFADPKDPEFIKSFCSVWKRESILKGYERYMSITEICIPKLQLTAHIFFVEDFKMENELVGLANMVDLVFMTIA
jgi:hypothetical protein